ncbi:hypothetical protein C0J50_9371 [Silurus asotus]|uniref:Transposase n=1 Tax=Silurus asotus TaxID=30991 RepID=A0AAD5A4K8_SILAS|nr:hypothetical protein C0J50_9371 [Silurus asotus]
MNKGVRRKHTNHLERYTQLTLTALKRRSSDEGPSSKQIKLWKTKRVSQHSVDEAIVNFVIQGLHPLSVVEQEGFKSLVHLLQPSVAVMSRGTVKNKVQKATHEIKNNLKAAMSETEFIATTTDCWAAHRQSFIGVTAHWIDPETLQRCYAALASQQLKGTHCFSALAGAMYEIHTEFNLCDKIIGTTTDNGSNFLKAIRIYSELEENINSENVEGARQSQVGKRESGDDDDDDYGNGNNEGVEAGTMLDQDDGLEFQLPKHHRCACHLLNLGSTVDVLEANLNSAYKRLSRSAFAKCSSLWHKSARSTTAAKISRENCHLQLLRPNDTRWNSIFLAVERIVRIVREQGERGITAVCSALQISMDCKITTMSHGRRPRVWIIGSSIIVRLRSYLSAHRLDENLGLDCDIIWDGEGGRRWEHLLPLLHEKRAATDSDPDVIIIHLGVNSIGLPGTNRVDLICRMKSDIKEAHMLFPTQNHVLRHPSSLGLEAPDLY